MILYHNTSNENAVSISRTGLKGGMRADAYGKGSEGEASGIWCRNERGYGNGGATITFEVDDNDPDLVKQNDTEFIIYHDIPTENIIDIDLIIADFKSNIERTDDMNTTVESDIPTVLKRHGKEKVLSVFKKNEKHFIKPYDYEELEELINTGNKMLKGTINIPKQTNEGITINLKEFNINNLNEAKLNQLIGKTRSQTPELADRSDFVDTDYIGISKFGIFNFRTTSQTHDGNYWYQTVEIPDLQAKLIDEKIDASYMRYLFEQEDIKLYCDDPSFLYWAFKYMAYTKDYGIEPENRAPKRNNVRLKGALCKHLLSVVELIKSGTLYEQMAKDAQNWLAYMKGDKYSNFHKARLMGDAKKKKNRISWENYDSYMNDYFASKAGVNKFLDDEDIKQSLKDEIVRTAKTDPNMTLDDFITDEFGVEGIDGLANELQIDKDYIKQYFKDIGW